MSEYGCHVDLLPGDKPDGCVFDEPDKRRISDCTQALFLSRWGRGKDGCKYWAPSKGDDETTLSRAYALIEEMREALKRIDASGSGMVMASGAQYVVPMHSIEIAREIVATADAFLAERVK